MVDFTTDADKDIPDNHWLCAGYIFEMNKNNNNVMNKFTQIKYYTLFCSWYLRTTGSQYECRAVGTIFSLHSIYYQLFTTKS